MAIVVILEHKGDPERLMAAGKELARLAPHPDGVLAQAIAPTEDGMMLVRIWASEQARGAWAENPEHHAALKASGIFELSLPHIARVPDRRGVGVRHRRQLSSTEPTRADPSRFSPQHSHCSLIVGNCDEVKAGFGHPDRPPWRPLVDPL